MDMENEVPPTPTEKFLPVKNFDAVFEYVGGLGIWQWKIFFLSTYSVGMLALGNLAGVFIGATPDFWCSIPELGNRSLEFYEYMKNSSVTGPDQCQYRQSDLEEFLGDQLTIPADTNGSIIKCSKWEYDHSQFTDTIVTDWDLVCDRTWLKSTSQSTFMLGVLIGSVIISELSDVYGRRATTVASSMLMVITTASTSLAPDYISFVILRFISSLFCIGVFLSTFVLVLEIISPKYRGVLGLLDNASFSIGMIILPGISYFVPKWRTFQVVVSALGLFMTSYYWCIPESPRWLILQGRKAEALDILENAAKTNHKNKFEISQIGNIVMAAETIPKQKTSFVRRIKHFFANQMVLYSSPDLRTRSLVLLYFFLVTSVVFYGLATSSENLKLSLHSSFAVGGIADLLGIVIAAICVERVRRRLLFSFCFVVTGLCCIGTVYVPMNWSLLKMGTLTMGKLFIAIVFTLEFVVAAELYPTNIRNTAVGASSLWARVGGAIAPYVVDLVGAIHYAIPMVLFGVLALIAGALTWFLPETKGKPLMETIEDVKLQVQRDKSKTKESMPENEDK